jgi:DNA-binding NtrC family response regulator
MKANENFKVMVVEDDDVTLRQLAKAIRKEGYEVITASNGAIALEIYREKRPEIVVTDISMPEMSGLELLTEVKRINSHAQVILATGLGEVDSAVSALHKGAIDYLKKPIDLDMLTLALGRAREKALEYTKIEEYPNILLVEDDESTRNRLARVISKDDYVVYVAGDGEEALQVFQESKIDIVLTDLRMPKKNGIDTLKEMRDITMDFESIILTGYGDESSVIEALRLGANSFIKKPIDLDQLSVSLEKAMESLNLKRALRFRERELTLSEEFIGRFTNQEMIIHDLDVERMDKESRDFTINLINSLPLCLAIVHADGRVCGANKTLVDLIGSKPDTIDQEFIDSLAKVGFQDLSLENVSRSWEQVFSASLNKVEIVNAGAYASITIFPVTMLSKGRHEKMAIFLFRGQRK